MRVFAGRGSLDSRAEGSPLLSEVHSGYASFSASSTASASGKTSVQEAADRCLSSAWFEPTLAVAAVLDAAAVGFEIDNAELASPATWLTIMAIFNLLFSAELCVRALSEHLGVLLKTPLLLGLTIVATLVWLKLLVAAWPWCLPGAEMAWYQVPNGAVQILRICRAARLVGLSPDCRGLLRQLVQSLPELGWVTVLMFMTFFLAAAVTTIVIGHSEVQAAAMFSNLETSMFTLLVLMLLESWPDILRPLLFERWEWVPPLVAFLFVTHCFLLNVMTAVLVEKTLAVRKAGGDQERLQQAAEQKALLERLCGELQRLNGGGEAVSRDHFKRWLVHNRLISQTMRDLDFKQDFMLACFALCDHEGTGRVSLTRLMQIWEGSKSPLTIVNCQDSQNHLLRRLEQIEQLNSVVMSGVSRMVSQRGPSEQQ